MAITRKFPITTKTLNKMRWCLDEIQTKGEKFGTNLDYLNFDFGLEEAAAAALE